MTDQNSPLPSASLSRLALYLRAAQELEQRGVLATSSRELAELAGVQPFHVRKDLAYLGRFGRRGQGYAVALLRRELTRSLGLNRRWQYIVVGLDLLGQALLKADWGEEFVCVGLFDPSPQQQGRRLDVPALPQPFTLGQLPPVPRTLRVRPLSELADFVQKQAVDMAFLCVPTEISSHTAQQLQQAGIRGILNFGPALNPPHLPQGGHEENDTIVEQVDFQVSLQRLAFGLLRQSIPQLTPTLLENPT